MSRKISVHASVSSGSTATTSSMRRSSTICWHNSSMASAPRKARLETITARIVTVPSAASPGEVPGRIVRGNLGYPGRNGCKPRRRVGLRCRRWEPLACSGAARPLRHRCRWLPPGACIPSRSSRRYRRSPYFCHDQGLPCRRCRRRDAGSRARYAVFDLMHGGHPPPGMRRRRGYTARGSRARAQS